MNIHSTGGEGSARMAGTRRSEQAERRRNQLIDVALELFAERGIEGVRISDIAEKAGVAQGLLYRYFSGKEALLGAIAERHSPLLLVREALTALPNRPASETLTALAGRIYALLQERRSLVRLVVRDVIWRPESREVAMGIREIALDLVTQYLRSRVAAGELRPHNSVVVAQTFASAVILAGIAGLPFDPFVSGAVEVVLNGITVGSASV